MCSVVCVVCGVCRCGMCGVCSVVCVECVVWCVSGCVVWCVSGYGCISHSLVQLLSIYGGDSIRAVI